MNPIVRALLGQQAQGGMQQRTPGLIGPPVGPPDGTIEQPPGPPPPPPFQPPPNSSLLGGGYFQVPNNSKGLQNDPYADLITHPGKVGYYIPNQYHDS